VSTPDDTRLRPDRDSAVEEDVQAIRRWEHAILLARSGHLDLQIDLPAEREMTAVLQLLQDIARHLDVQTIVTPEQLRDLMTKTDVRRLTNRMEELAEPATATAARATKAGGESSNNPPS
jgi:hypothetical protein